MIRRQWEHPSSVTRLSMPCEGELVRIVFPEYRGAIRGRRIGGREADVAEVKVSVELENFGDRLLVMRGAISEAEVRSERVEILADTGSTLMMLPQDLVERLGLIELRKGVVTYADERKEERPIAGVVTVRVGDRAAQVECVVGPPNSEPLLGQIPIESLDLLVDCARHQLVPRPESPYLPLFKMK